MNADALLMVFIFAGVIISAVWQGKLKKIITNEKRGGGNSEIHRH